MSSPGVQALTCDAVVLLRFAAKPPTADARDPFTSPDLLCSLP